MRQAAGALALTQLTFQALAAGGKFTGYFSL
ncbi:hypothetical protein EHW99_3420 [Erwinia amylovora]|nr:hypothetical protein EHX00_3420 [Erwinia amylovora]QJQ59818.1 hypothetical protein EHW99_3420 [Erwinia amylovora]QJQ63517.1 hypothetical protein EHW98_3420 [Erwinia amylovora]QJQ67319.1 hypothetical protein EHW96_3420 [Erwinia amylovora]QJQ71018.1 hypothetical protein EGZ89_3420 [Erwinia amylovora]